MSESAIRQALEGQLKPYASSKGLLVQYQNQRFDAAPDEKAYLRATIRWAPAVANDICSGEELSGVFLIDIFGLPLKGADETDQIIADLKLEFPLDQVLNESGIQVWQRTPLRVATAIPGPSRYMVPTSFDFTTYV